MTRLSEILVHMEGQDASVDEISDLGLFFFVFVFFFCILSFKGCACAYGGSQASGLIGAVAAGLRQSHSNARSKLHL